MSSENMPIRQNTDGVLYKEEEYMKVFAKEHQPKKRGRPFGSKIILKSVIVFLGKK